MAGSGVSGLGVATVAAGALFAWSGIKGASVTTALRGLISGQQPSGSDASPLTAAPTGGGAAGGGGGAGDSGASTADAAKAQSIARVLAAAYGWTEGNGQFTYLRYLWNRESGWNRLARNSSSGAYGIPQSLPASKMGPLANPPASSATAQIQWGLSYIQQRYGNPQAAWAHESQYGWY